MSTTPAELFVTEGEPQLAAILGTTLSYVSNTGSDIFLDTHESELLHPDRRTVVPVDVAAERSVDVRCRRQPAAGLRQDPDLQSESQRAGFGSRHAAGERSTDRQRDSADGNHLAQRRHADRHLRRRARLPADRRARR